MLDLNNNFTLNHNISKIQLNNNLIIYCPSYVNLCGQITKTVYWVMDKLHNNQKYLRYTCHLIKKLNFSLRFFEANLT